MIHRRGFDDPGRTLVCVDSYENGILEGRIYNPYQEMESFESLSRFLIKMESLLDELQTPQAYTATRTFSNPAVLLDFQSAPMSFRRGAEATFELQVFYRQHTSWQGVIYWREQHLEQHFRSVLELVFLLDSALRRLERREFA